MREPTPLVLSVLNALENDELPLLQGMLNVEISAQSRFHQYDSFPRDLCDGPPLVSVAAYFGSQNCFRFLLANNTTLPVDCKDRTVFHYAVLGGNISVMTVLLMSKPPDPHDLVTLIRHGTVPQMFLFFPYFKMPLKKAMETRPSFQFLTVDSPLTVTTLFNLNLLGPDEATQFVRAFFGRDYVVKQVRSLMPMINSAPAIVAALQSDEVISDRSVSLEFILPFIASKHFFPKLMSVGRIDDAIELFKLDRSFKMDKKINSVFAGLLRHGHHKQACQIAGMVRGTARLENSSMTLLEYAISQRYDGILFYQAHRKHFGITATNGSPLQFLFVYGNMPTFIRDLAGDLNKSLVDKKGQTMLHVAARLGYLRCARALLEPNICDWRKTDNNGQTAPQLNRVLAAYINQDAFDLHHNFAFEVLGLFINVGNVNTINSTGATLLMHAIRTKNIEVLHLLLIYWPDFVIVDKKGHSALTDAIRTDLKDDIFWRNANRLLWIENLPKSSVPIAFLLVTDNHPDLILFMHTIVRADWFYSTGPKGMTLLHLAVKLSKRDVCHALLQVEPGLRLIADDDMRLPLDYAPNEDFILFLSRTADKL